jgi:hypothetical protein
MMGWLDYWFSGFRWYRKWCGGHWEKWYMALVDGEKWFSVERCFDSGAERPTPLCLGQPIVCEDHPEWMLIDHEDWR